MRKSDRMFILGTVMVGLGALITYKSGLEQREEDLYDCLNESDCNLGVFKKKGKHIMLAPVLKPEETED